MITKLQPIEFIASQYLKKCNIDRLKTRDVVHVYVELCLLQIGIEHTELTQSPRHHRHTNLLKLQLFPEKSNYKNQDLYKICYVFFLSLLKKQPQKTDRSAISCAQSNRWTKGTYVSMITERHFFKRTYCRINTIIIYLRYIIFANQRLNSKFFGYKVFLKAIIIFQQKFQWLKFQVI